MTEVTRTTYLYQCPACGSWELQTETGLDICSKCNTKMELVKERSWSYDEDQMQTVIAAPKVVPAASAITEPSVFINTVPYVASGIVCIVLIAVFFALAKRMFSTPNTRK